MRYINTTSYKPKGYIRSSQQKLIELRKCVDSNARKEFMDIGANRIWTSLKDDFERLSNYKCWFSEAYASISDFHIEHFRPKKKVHLITTRDAYAEKRTTSDPVGYWWLSYDIRNLKLAGAKPNQTKSNYFPLKSTSIIATELNETWKKEEPALLDPCNKDDVKLLTYSGVDPIESNQDTLDWDHIRARISIKIFGLKHKKLRNARTALFAHLNNYIDTGIKHWTYLELHKALKPDGYNEIREIFINVCLNIVEMTNPKEQFTMMVYAHLYSLNIIWIDRYVIAEAKSRKYIN